MSKSWFDAAGWVFWMVVCVILAGPCIYGVWRLFDHHVNRLYPIGTGVFLAVVGAGVFTWAVNSVLQWREKKQRIERRKKARKRK